jgi:threonine dehydrogenase-like Zn-dependent dehydrogenase
MATATAPAPLLTPTTAQANGRATRTMRAFVLRRPNEVAVIDKPIPTAGPNDAIVKTTVAMICTSDVHTAKGVLPIEADRTLGHEAVGTVYQLGSAVTGFAVGDRVLVNAITPCFQCEACQRGDTSQCGGMLGGYKFTMQKDGNLAEYFSVNDARANLVHIPDGVSDEAAVYATDMLSTGFMGAENAGIRLGDTVAIFAQGPVGLSATIGARLLGAGLIIAVEADPERQSLAREFGADHIVDFTQGDAVQQILDLTGGKGVDSAIEALGMPQTFEACVRVTKPGGTISNIGYHGEVAEPLRIPLAEFGMGMAGKTIRTGLCPGGSERMTRILRLLESGRIDPTRMTTHRFTFNRVEDAFRLMQTKADGVIKPLVQF